MSNKSKAAKKFKVEIMERTKPKDILKPEIKEKLPIIISLIEENLNVHGWEALEISELEMALKEYEEDKKILNKNWTEYVISRMLVNLPEEEKSALEDFLNGIDIQADNTLLAKQHQKSKENYRQYNGYSEEKYIHILRQFRNIIQNNIGLSKKGERIRETKYSEADYKLANNTLEAIKEALKPTKGISPVCNLECIATNLEKLFVEELVERNNGILQSKITYIRTYATRDSEKAKEGLSNKKETTSASRRTRKIEALKEARTQLFSQEPIKKEEIESGTEGMEEYIGEIHSSETPISILTKQKA